jgi:hypothetical protein
MIITLVRGEHMLYLHDENLNIYKAAAIAEPDIYSSSRYTSIIKYIDEESIMFYYIKGSGTHFFFKYQDKWHKMLRPGIRDYEFASKFTIIK